MSNPIEDLKSALDTFSAAILEATCKPQVQSEKITLELDYDKLAETMRSVLSEFTVPSDLTAPVQKRTRKVKESAAKVEPESITVPVQKSEPVVEVTKDEPKLDSMDDIDEWQEAAAEIKPAAPVKTETSKSKPEPKEETLDDLEVKAAASNLSDRIEFFSANPNALTQAILAVMRSERKELVVKIKDRLIGEVGGQSISALTSADNIRKTAEVIAQAEQELAA